MVPPDLQWKEPVYMVIDPAAGGPQSDFALVTFTRTKGLITVLRTPASGRHIRHL